MIPSWMILLQMMVDYNGCRHSTICQVSNCWRSTVADCEILVPNIGQLFRDYACPRGACPITADVCAQNVQKGYTIGCICVYNVYMYMLHVLAIWHLAGQKCPGKIFMLLSFHTWTSWTWWLTACSLHACRSSDTPVSLLMLVCPLQVAMQVPGSDII